MHSCQNVEQSHADCCDVTYRFAGVVYPGETLITSMWKEGDKVIFVTKTKERDSIVLAAAAATLVSGAAKAKL